VDHIQTTITLLISFEKIQNFCSNLRFECVLPKILKPHLKIPYHSELIVETVTVRHFSTHFRRDYGSWI